MIKYSVFSSLDRCYHSVLQKNTITKLSSWALYDPTHKPPRKIMSAPLLTLLFVEKSHFSLDFPSLSGTMVHGGFIYYYYNTILPKVLLMIVLIRGEMLLQSHFKAKLTRLLVLIGNAVYESVYFTRSSNG